MLTHTLQQVGLPMKKTNKLFLRTLIFANIVYGSCKPTVGYFKSDGSLRQVVHFVDIILRPHQRLLPYPSVGRVFPYEYY